MKNILVILSMAAGLSIPMLAAAEDTNTTAPGGANQTQQNDANQEKAHKNGAPVASDAQTDAADVSDADLDKFVQASKSINEVQQKFSQDMQGEKDQEKVQKLQQDAHNDMTKAIVSSGLTLEEYNNLARTIQQNPELLKKVQGKMQQQ